MVSGEKIVFGVEAQFLVFYYGKVVVEGGFGARQVRFLPLSAETS